MRIAEIFYSIQGEGRLTGVPSVFIRTSGCNLRCRWCDTPYASWNPEGAEMTVADILAVVEKYPARHVVVTGGEPMIARNISELLHALRDSEKHITIETAGTVAPNRVPCDLASLSPKLKNSVPDPETFGKTWTERHEATRWRPEILREWCATYDHQIK
ncbi:MAG: 7-carboxy-7-deazaguanine synthase QueE, partial [Verrucomicrobia bacterium]|nr:7-carboxy-7-deazaguanine synthase QueE [Verrucomicrobiota bacterium]